MKYASNIGLDPLFWFQMTKGYNSLKIVHYSKPFSIIIYKMIRC